MSNEKKYLNRISWEIPENIKPERDKRWYIFASIIFFLLIFFSFFTISSWRLVFLGPNSNFLFALIIVISAAIIVINESKETEMLEFTLTPEGVDVAGRFYYYDQFKNFSVIYKPKEDIKQLYLEFKNAVRPRLSVPLLEMNPIEIRNYLDKYLEEDLERTDPPLSEQLTNILKL